VIVSPTGADAAGGAETINGVATAVTIKPGTMRVFIADGISNWRTLGWDFGAPTAAYDATGVAATDRTIADLDTLPDTISVLGTLIKDLQAKGILG
jgi:hypothetical protein